MQKFVFQEESGYLRGKMLCYGAVVRSGVVSLSCFYWSFIQPSPASLDLN